MANNTRRHRENDEIATERIIMKPTVIRIQPALDLKTVKDARNILRTRRIEHDIPEITRAQINRLKLIPR